LIKCWQDGKGVHKKVVGAICATKNHMREPNPQHLEYANKVASLFLSLKTNLECGFVFAYAITITISVVDAFKVSS
jgi:hypothetical protein